VLHEFVKTESNESGLKNYITKTYWSKWYGVYDMVCFFFFWIYLHSPHPKLSQIFHRKRSSVTYNKGRGNKRMTPGTVWGVDVYAGFLKNADSCIFLFWLYPSNTIP